MEKSDLDAFRKEMRETRLSNLTSVDMVVKSMILAFPSLFKSRMSCFGHLFATNGTGYGWANGKLTGSYDDLKMPDSINMDDGYLPRNDISTDYELMVRTFMGEHIDELVVGHFNATEPSITSVYPMSWDYCNMAKAADNPELIDKEWRLAIEEYCLWILSESNSKFHAIDDDPAVRLTRIPEGRYRKNYEIALKVKDMITPSEEKAEREDRMNAVREMLKEKD